MTVSKKGRTTTSDLMREILEIVRHARGGAYQAVNAAMVEAYWRIGRRLVKEEQQGRARAGYGQEIVRTVAQQLTAEFGRGFSEPNVWNFRQFYLTYPSEKILYTLRRELSWSHHRLIMRVENQQAREFYMDEVADQRWSTRQLERNITSLYYERLLSSRRRPSLAAKAAVTSGVEVDDHLKDPYVFEFLGLPMPPGFNEAEFETAIIGNLQRVFVGVGQRLLVCRQAIPNQYRDQALLHRSGLLQLSTQVFCAD